MKLRKIIEWLPPKLQEVIDYQEISEAFENKYNEQLQSIERMKDNTNLLKMDEETIKYYENMLGIEPSATATLEERRYTIWLKKTLKTPYTEQWLRHWLDNLLGKNKYKLNMTFQKHLILQIALSNEKNFESVKQLLETVVPAHISFMIGYLYNTYGEIKSKSYTYASLKSMTYKEIKEKEDM